MKSYGYRRLVPEAAVTATAMCCWDRVWLAIGSENWFTVECSAWEHVRWEIGALTLGYGCLEPFVLLTLYSTPSLPGGGHGIAVVTLGDCLR